MTQAPVPTATGTLPVPAPSGPERPAVTASDAELAALIADDAVWPRPGDDPVQVPAVSPWWHDAPWGGSGRPWLDARAPVPSGVSGQDEFPADHVPLAAAPVTHGVDDARPSSGNAGAGLLLVLLGGAGSLALALLTGRAWGRAATNVGELDWGVLTTSDAHAGLFTLGWLLATVVLGAGWLLCHARRRTSQAALWAMLAATAIPVLSVLGALAMLAPALDNIPG